MGKARELTRNVWILGGTGFIGRSLVNYLSADPSNKLHLLVHKNIAYRNLEKFNVFAGSLDTFDLTWFNRYKPDVVFHLARMAGSGPVRRQVAAKRGQEANERLLGFFQSMEHPPVVVYVSGSLMYGNQEGGTAADEWSPLNPVAFARNYIRAELPWTKSAGLPGSRIKIVRPGWIVGPVSWFRIFFWHHYISTGKVPVYGDGCQLMSMIQIEDLGEMIGRVPDMEPSVMNLFAGAPVAQSEFSNKMAAILGSTTEYIPFNQIRRKYGTAEAEALTSSIPLTTLYREFWTNHRYRYPEPEDMLARILRMLKSEQGIFTETPKSGMIKPLIHQPEYPS
ncbi:MAG: NAD(P)-dependent oxidoreductase [Bacteroidales bacterium]|jgi:nucleoside-diphosphate-sugar epimerase